MQFCMKKARSSSNVLKNALLNASCWYPKLHNYHGPLPSAIIGQFLCTVWASVSNIKKSQHSCMWYKLLEASKDDTFNVALYSNTVICVNSENFNFSETDLVTLWYTFAATNLIQFDTHQTKIKYLLMCGALETHNI